MDKKIWIGIVVLILAGAIFIFGKGITGNSVSAAEGLIDEGNTVKVSVNEVSSNAVWYDYNGIKFFIVKDKKNNIKTAFDACDVCYKSRKGYSQNGDDMVCNNCGNHYPISELGTANLRGGCWPASHFLYPFPTWRSQHHFS